MAPEEAAAALAGYAPAGMRQKVVEKGGVTVIEDCYNASPDSMAAALATLGSFPVTGKKIFVASDMLELGEIAGRCHRKIGETAAQSGADILLACGELAREMVEAAREAGMADARFFPEKKELSAALVRLARPGDLIWFKGSRCMKLEEVVEDLYASLK